MQLYMRRHIGMHMMYINIYAADGWLGFTLTCREQDRLMYAMRLPDLVHVLRTIQYGRIASSCSEAAVYARCCLRYC